MNVKVSDIVNSIDLCSNEAFLPIYESIVNSIISLCKIDTEDKCVDVFIEREDQSREVDLFGKEQSPIKTITIVDNGEGFTDENYASFNAPYSDVNKRFGCKGLGRFTMLAMFENIEIVSIYRKGTKMWKRSFGFNAHDEIHNLVNVEVEDACRNQTKVVLLGCRTPELRTATAKSADEIARGIMNHCFIYYLCNQLPIINIIDGGKSLNVLDYFKRESKDKEKTITVKGEDFHLYVLKSNKTTSRRYNYVTLCANSRSVGKKYKMGDYDSLYLYPITEDGEVKFVDVYVVSSYLDSHINNARTAFRIPDINDNPLGLEGASNEISVDDIIKGITAEMSSIYESFAKQTKQRSIAEVKKYIESRAPQYRSFLYRQDILDAMPPNLSDEKKDEYFHKISFRENRKINDKIDEFIQQKELNDEKIQAIVSTIREKAAYDVDSLTDYVMRRKAIIDLFERMLDAREDGKYELEAMIHNLIFPMGLTNRQLNYQYHNLWLLDDRFSTFRFIASDKSITSFSQIKSSKEPDLILINSEDNLLDNPISYGDKDAGEIGMMVIFEFKRPGDTAHQKKELDYRWEFSELVEKYFDDFMFGKEKEKKNYRGNVVEVSIDTPKFGFVIMDEMPRPLVEFNKSKGWRKTPFGSYYKINPDQNLHIEAIKFQDLLSNAKNRNNPFFDHLFTTKI